MWLPDPPNLGQEAQVSAQLATCLPNSHKMTPTAQMSQEKPYGLLLTISGLAYRYVVINGANGSELGKSFLPGPMRNTEFPKSQIVTEVRAPDTCCNKQFAAFMSLCNTE